MQRIIYVGKSPFEPIRSFLAVAIGEEKVRLCTPLPLAAPGHTLPSPQTSDQQTQDQPHPLASTGPLP